MIKRKVQSSSHQEDEGRTVIQDKYLNALAGATAGMAASFMVCPLDVVKTRLQGQVHSPGQVLKYNGTFATLAQIFREEGIRGSYRGLSPTLLGMVPTWATYFSSYNAIKQYIEGGRFVQESGNSQPLVHMISACGAGILTATVTNPIWVVKTRIQMISSSACQYTGTWDAFAKILREEGVAGFYKGLGPSLLGVSHITIQFPLYERLKQDMAQGVADENGKVDGGSIGIFHLIASATISKILASLFTYPHEVVRTRMYMTKGVPLNMLAAYVGLFREGGIVALYRGFLTNAVRVVPASAVTFVSYELVYSLLDGWYGDRGEVVRSDSVVHKEALVAHHK